MINLCKSCCYPNLPDKILCERCHRRIVEEEDEARVLERWQDLPGPIKEEYCAKYKKLQERYMERLSKIRKDWFKHVAAGFLIFALLGSFQGSGLDWLWVDIIIGITAMFILNRKFGGAYWGLGLIAGGYILSFGIKLLAGYKPSGGVLNIQTAQLFYYFLAGGLLAACTGYLLGTLISVANFDAGL